jgi:conjugal transfer pilus assembly protein TraF
VSKYIWLCLLFVSTSFATQRQGVFYYEKPIKEYEQNPVDDPKPLSATEKVEKLRQEYNKSLNEAIISPTYDNVLKERQLNKLLSDLAENYQKSATRVINNEPSLNYSLTHPVNHAARRSHDARVVQKNRKKIRKLAQDNGLFFFFSSSCPHCHSFAPTVKMLEKEYGFTILPISIDGIGIDDFPSFRANSGQAEAMLIKSLPALAIARPKDNTSFVISYGDVSLSEIEDKLIDIMESSNA